MRRLGLYDRYYGVDRRSNVCEDCEKKTQGYLHSTPDQRRVCSECYVKYNTPCVAKGANDETK